MTAQELIDELKKHPTAEVRMLLSDGRNTEINAVEYNTNPIGGTIYIDCGL